MKLPMLFLAACIGIAVAAEPPRNTGMSAAAGEKRIALVIGNSAYKDAPLKNPANDARDVAAALRKLGFEVIEKTNVPQKEMNRAIVQFGEKLRADTVALFYYAGHGMQVRGKNYLIPVDAQIQSEASVRVEAVDVDGVLDQLTISPLNIVILDACRNNPFERRFRSVGGGLAQMDAPKGSLIAYATAPGKTAADGDNRNGLYTQELLKHIQTPGLPLETVFKRVRIGVMAASGDAQTPWETSSLTGDFFFRPGSGSAPPPIPEAAPTDPAADEIAQWRNIEHSTDVTDFEQYLQRFPNSRYATLAKAVQQKLQGDAATPTTTQATAQGSATSAREVADGERQAQPAQSADPIDLSGTWNPEHAPGQVYIFSDGSCTYKGFLIISIGCQWRRPDANKREFVIVWNHGYTDTMTLSSDGQRLIGRNNVGDPVAFTRSR
ncbi:caspase family protein [Propionivibrio dicarboxylicus]|uniref:Caspase domain-containing protein n=1 Tax=Propionivibrio dicarboxylicus TaxID=83767 RepID=A0A1G8BGH7_9RHOO|nr:caspase domain-containing protein [Propionivibrio dicarboxylicus]SDH32356.1 Caspase domain-containing protein [Propionivibrio dicarboxylicus]